MSGERAILTKRITASIESWMNFKLWMKFMWNVFEHDIVLVVNFGHNFGEKAIFTNNVKCPERKPFWQSKWLPLNEV